MSFLYVSVLLDFDVVDGLEAKIESVEICLINGVDCWSLGFSYSLCENAPVAPEVAPGGVNRERYVELKECWLLRTVLASSLFLLGENRELTEPVATAK